MKGQIFLLWVVVTLVLHINLGFCEEKVEETEKDAARTKRQVYNYFYGSGGSYQQGGDDYYVNECGYISSGSYQSSQYGGANYNEESFISYNEFPPKEKIIEISTAEINEVIGLARAIQSGKCNKENVLVVLGIAKPVDKCVPDDLLENELKKTNLLEIVYEILAYRYKVDRFDVVKFVPAEPLSSEICIPIDQIDVPNISELNRLLPPHCVLDDSKLLRRLPSPRSLSLLFEQYNKYQGYDTATCLNSFGFFLFQAVSHDVQKLTPKSACAKTCIKHSGCEEDEKIALTDSLLTDSVDVLHICSADPFYGFYGASCMTSPKLQNINSDCQIRKRAPLNRASKFLDLDFVYGSVTPAADGSFPVSGLLPDFQDLRADQTTPLLAIHNLIVVSHNALAEIIRNEFTTYSGSQIFFYAQLANKYIWQRIIYEYLLPALLGPVATSHYNIDSQDSCYDPENVLEVPVEVIVVALRYCHAYIPEEYQLLLSNYEIFDKQDLDKKLSPEAFNQFFVHIVRGLFASKVGTQKSSCAYANNYAQSNVGYQDDLRALDVQAARDACVEPYLQYLTQIYNISATGDWDSYRMFFRGDQIKFLSYLYKNPQELELAVGGALDNHHQSVFGDLFKIFISNFFSDLKCSDPQFWSNAQSGDIKEFIGKLDVIDWIGCILGLESRPNNLFCPYDASNPLVPVTCASKKALIALAASLHDA